MVGDVLRVDDDSDSHLKPTGAHRCGFLMTTSLVMGLVGYGRRLAKKDEGRCLVVVIVE
mgnify:CR=1 FL=1